MISSSFLFGHAGDPPGGSCRRRYIAVPEKPAAGAKNLRLAPRHDES